MSGATRTDPNRDVEPITEMPTLQVSTSGLSNAASREPGATNEISTDTVVAASETSTSTTASGGTSSGAAEGALSPGDIFHGDFRIADMPPKFGGMGAVYRAINVINGATVAIKLIRYELSSDPELVKRFKDEDNALRLLSNPAIVRYFGVRREPQLDRLYIVMEYVDGPSLGGYLNRNGALSKDDAVSLCRRLVHGLEAAHAQGIIHRDLSPDNILLPESDLGQAKIIDFGIAKVKTQEEFTAYRTSFVGKLSYASPEHFSQTARVDEKSDIYSLGLILAAAVRGKPLEMGTDYLTGATARLRLPDMAGIPAELRPLLARMLSPKPETRPTAAEVAAALQRLVPSGSRGGSAWLWRGVALLVLASISFAGVRFTLQDRTGSGSPPPETQPQQTAGRLPLPAPPRPAVSRLPLRDTLDTLNRAIQSAAPACSPLHASGTSPDRIALEGLVADAADYSQVKAAAASIGTTLDDHVIVSSPACLALRRMDRLGWIGASPASSKPILSVGRTPPTFFVGETVRVNMVVRPSGAGRHVYKIFADEKGAVTVEHSFERSYAQMSSAAPVREPGWNLVVLISAAGDIRQLDAIGNASIDLLNDALASIAGSDTEASDVVAVYQLVSRVPSAQ